MPRVWPKRTILFVRNLWWIGWIANCTLAKDPADPQFFNTSFLFNSKVDFLQFQGQRLLILEHFLTLILGSKNVPKLAANLSCHRCQAILPKPFPASKKATLFWASVLLFCAIWPSTAICRYGAKVLRRTRNLSHLVCQHVGAWAGSRSIAW